MPTNILAQLNTEKIANEFNDFLAAQGLGDMNPSSASRYRQGVEASPMDEILEFNGLDLDSLFKRQLPPAPVLADLTFADNTTAESKEDILYTINALNLTNESLNSLASLLKTGSINGTGNLPAPLVTLLSSPAVTSPSSLIDSLTKFVKLYGDQGPPKTTDIATRMLELMNHINTNDPKKLIKYLDADISLLKKVDVTYLPTNTISDLVKLLSLTKPFIANPAAYDIGGHVDIYYKTSTWNDVVQLIKLVRGTAKSDNITGAQSILKHQLHQQGSILEGGNGDDVITGFAGWDRIDGGSGRDLIFGGNGRDILSGGFGPDEVHGGFGWNTFLSERDNSKDLIVIKSDKFLFNKIYGKKDNNKNNSKCDVIESLDPIDKIIIQGIGSDVLNIKSNIKYKDVTGIGIYAENSLEAIYIGNNLTVQELKSMVVGDRSANVLSSSHGPYGQW